MNMNEQRDKWLASHPNATAKEAWEAGYFTSTSNWCNRER